MIRVFAVLLLGFIYYFVYVQGLECGLTKQLEEEELQNAFHKCLGKPLEPTETSSNNTSNSTESSEETVQDSYSAHRGFGSRNRKKRDEDSNTNHTAQATNDDVIDTKCLLQCIFNDLDMVDTSGFPEHQRVVQGLLKNARGRELRDFIQDSTDQCYQLMDQGDKPDACDYSIRLVTCLAEKGRSNCADWQILNLPFNIHPTPTN